MIDQTIWVLQGVFIQRTCYTYDYYNIVSKCSVPFVVCERRVRESHCGDYFQTVDNSAALFPHFRLGRAYRKAAG